MKSSEAELRKRGFALQEDIDLLKDKTQEELFNLLNADNAAVRTAAVYKLAKVYFDESILTKCLLERLSKENCLYTKIAICETLEMGGTETAEQMITYLGMIGKNQYQSLPDRVSKKKSYPLARDIIARTLANMSTDIFPILLKELQEELQREDNFKISELLDAIGFMVFYHQELADCQTMNIIHEIIKKKEKNQLIVWKAVLCLSAFPFPKNKEFLENFICTRKNLQNTPLAMESDDILEAEAQRSLFFINKKLKRIL